MSQLQGWITPEFLNRITNLLKKAHLPTTLINPHTEAELGVVKHTELINSLDTEKFIDLMSMDKKVADGQLSLVLLKGELGNCLITNKFDTKLLRQTVTEYCKK